MNIVHIFIKKMFFKTPHQNQEDNKMKILVSQLSCHFTVRWSAKFFIFYMTNSTKATQVDAEDGFIRSLGKRMEEPRWVKLEILLTIHEDYKLNEDGW